MKLIFFVHMYSLKWKGSSGAQAHYVSENQKGFSSLSQAWKMESNPVFPSLCLSELNDAKCIFLCLLQSIIKAGKHVFGLFLLKRDAYGASYRGVRSYSRMTVVNHFKAKSLEGQKSESSR